MPPISKTLTALLGGVVFSLICVSTAGASCAEPSPLPQHTLLTPPKLAALPPRLAEGGQPARVEDNGRHDRIVGTWHVTYEGFITAQAFTQWHSDGTEWENIDFPTLSGNICMGDWRATDESHVRKSHVGWLFTNGNPAGYFTMTETDEVARDGSWYRGTYEVKLYAPNGTEFAEGEGTAEAVRIPQP